jgi:hypothetical protein
MVCGRVNRVLVKDVVLGQIEEKILYIPFLWGKICEMETDMLGVRFVEFGECESDVKCPVSFA